MRKAPQGIFLCLYHFFYSFFLKPFVFNFLLYYTLQPIYYVIFEFFIIRICFRLFTFLSGYPIFPQYQLSSEIRNGDIEYMKQILRNLPLGKCSSIVNYHKTYLRLFVDVFDWHNILLGLHWNDHYSQMIQCEHNAQLCVKFGHKIPRVVDVIKVLIENGLNINYALESAYNNDPLVFTLLGSYDSFGSVVFSEILLLLSSSGLDMNALDNNGNGVLHVMIEKYSKYPNSLIHELIERGVKVNLANTSGDTALHFAARHFTYANAYSSVVANGKASAFFDTSKSHSKYGEIISILISLGADPNLINDAALTPKDCPSFGRDSCEDENSFNLRQKSELASLENVIKLAISNNNKCKYYLSNSRN